MPDEFRNQMQPPYSLQAEQSVLGSILIDPEKFKDVAAKTKERFETVKNAASEKAYDLAQGAREKIESLRSEQSDPAQHENGASEKIKDFAGSVQAKAKGLVGKAREKMEHFITDEDNK